jgi:hypothetical protein
MLSVVACSRVPAASVVSAVVSPDGENQAIIARSPTGVLDATGATLCVYDEYIASGRGWNPTHIASYKLPCGDPPPRAVWHAYNPAPHSFDVHLVDGSGRELGESSRTWQMLAPL